MRPAAFSRGSADSLLENATAFFHSEPQPGVRRIHHRVETDLSRVVTSIIQHRKRREWDPILVQLREWIPRLEADRSPAAAVFRERLRAIETCLGLADTMVESFLGGDTLAQLELVKLVEAASRQKK